MKRKSMIGQPIPCSTQEPEKLKCYACNGSGRYDVAGSPKCSSCDGTGVRDG